MLGGGDSGDGGGDRWWCWARMQCGVLVCACVCVYKILWYRQKAIGDWVVVVEEICVDNVILWASRCYFVGGAKGMNEERHVPLPCLR